jgi:hypothetical protein
LVSQQQAVVVAEVMLDLRKPGEAVVEVKGIVALALLETPLQLPPRKVLQEETPLLDFLVEVAVAEVPQELD